MIACAKPFRMPSEDAANGQFLLIRRDAYFAIGGHAAVRREICEDKALADLARQAGLRFRVLAAEQFEDETVRIQNRSVALFGGTSPYRQGGGLFVAAQTYPECADQADARGGLRCRI